MCDRGADSADLASQPSLSRFANRAGKGGLGAAKHVLTDHFIRRYKRRFTQPRHLTLDLDTDDPTHGRQEFALFNGYYDTHCHQHLLIHDAEGDLLCCALLPGKGDVRPSPNLSCACGQTTGLPARSCTTIARTSASHQKMVAHTEEMQRRALLLFNAADKTAPVQVFGEFDYQAKSWRQVRRIVAKAAHTLVGPDERLLVTNSSLAPVEVYGVYAGRDHEENWIKDLKRGLKSDRLSCSAFAANELRLVLFCVAYQLLHELRRRARAPLRTVRLDTLRLRFLRVAPRVKTTARRLSVVVSTTYAWRDDWLRLARGVGAAAG